jgi:hypothetical protein
LVELETQAAQLGYRYDGLIRVGVPALWTVVLVDTVGEELTFQAETIEDAVELATDRMALLSGLCDR